MAQIAAYIRVSTQQQKDEGSHVNQRDRICSWADQNGYDTGSIDTDTDETLHGQASGDIEWFEDLAVSGQSSNRDGYDALMDRYTEFEAVVVRELSRFGRDPPTLLNDVEAIVDSDTEFVSVTENFDTSSAMGKAFIRLVAVINGMYADLRREQAVRAAERRKTRGDPVGRPPKLDEQQREFVYDLREKGISYANIATLVTDEFGVDISRSTIKRYCDDAGVEQP